MKKLTNLKKRSGFTLVELLIVIIIIGILAGAMLLVAGSGTDSAEATKIISDLRSLKSAALLYYADHPTSSVAPTVTQLGGYMDRTLPGANFAVSPNATSSDTWWVGRIAIPEGGVRTKLAQRAGEVGLYNGSATAPTASEDYDGNGANAWIKAR
ncbi:MAG: Type II secretion system protein G precursor [Synergistetes bacterium ADurb.BinA166]|jgi:general secretion pathway protein G|nr:MAG: Type II secretion system protein G precursor [Synergistetes bacterium ADurb.BinA166]